MTKGRGYYENLILAEIDENRFKYIRFLASLVDAKSANPLGDTRPAAHIVGNFLDLHDVQHTTIAPVEHKPNVVADFDGTRGTGPRVIFNGRIDTFSADNTEDWRFNYPEFNDGTFIQGLGAANMKAGIAASAVAFTLLNKRRSLLAGSVALTAVSNEETEGVHGTKYLLEPCRSPSRWKGDVVLNGAPSGLQSVGFGEKGTLRLTFTVATEGANGAYAHRSCGAIVYASALIVSLKNEIEEMLVDLPQDIMKHLLSDKVRSVADGMMGAGAAKHLLKTSFNVGVIHGGVEVNVIPSTCVFEADIRLPISVEGTTVLAYMDEILISWPGVTYRVQEAASNSPSLSPLNHPFLGVIAEAAESVTGRRPTPLIGLDETDCRFYRHHGIPAFVFGPAPKVMRAQSEVVLIDEYLAIIKTHTLAVFRYLWSGKERTDDGLIS